MSSPNREAINESWTIKPRVPAMRYIYLLLLAGLMGWAYSNPATTAELLGVSGPSQDGINALVRNGILLVGAVFLVVLALAAYAKTRRVRRQGMPPSVADQ